MGGAPRQTFWPAVLLGAILVGAKAATYGVPDDGWSAAAFFAVTFEDVLFAAALGLLGTAALRASAGRPRLHGACATLLLLIAALSVAWALVSVKVYGQFGRAFRVQMLGLVGSWHDVRSSIEARLTPGVVAALLGLPALFAVTAVWTSRARAGMRARAAVAAVAVAWVAAGAWGRMGAEPWVGRMARSPHAALLASAVVELTGAREAMSSGEFPPAYLADFRRAEALRDPPATAGAPPRSVIVIVLESVGTRYLSLYGSAYDTTPCLAAEAASSVVFDGFYAHSGYTFCELMSIVFGIYPGLPWSYRPSGPRPLPQGLAANMRARGARTAYFHSGDIEWNGENYELQEAGFEELHGQDDLGGAPLSSWGKEDRHLFDALLAWLPRERGRPFFVMCWTDQTHDPYVLREGERPIDFFHGEHPPHEDDLARYLTILRDDDRQLGRLFAALRESGLADDTLVVVTGDHGEAFGTPRGHMGHGAGMNEEDLAVPLLLWNPRLFAPLEKTRRRISTVAGHADIVPTIADLLRIPPAPGWQGRSLFDPGRPPRTYFTLSWSRWQFGMRDGQWKYTFDADDGVEELFDLAADPGEEHDLSVRDAARTREGRARVAAFVAAEGDYIKSSGP